VGPKIGQGTFAVVHRGKETKEPHRGVAIKILRCQEELKGLDDAAYEMMLQAMGREIEAMEAIGKHPSIVPLVAKDRDGVVIVMELGSSDLHTVIKRQYADKGLPAHLMQTWAQGICEGVAYIHASGYVHQDLKSSNIIVFDDRTVKIGDFGLVREKQKTMRVDRELCTLWYRAPELLLCECTYSHKIDEWSIGVILLEMVMGGPPFRGDASRMCDCQKPNHRNFNNDQLACIFLVTGSPADDLIKDRDCREHLFGKIHSFLLHDFCFLK
jgi:serine/threonine protein kinase